MEHGRHGQQGQRSGSRDPASSNHSSAIEVRKGAGSRSLIEAFNDKGIKQRRADRLHRKGLLAKVLDTLGSIYNRKQQRLQRFRSRWRLPTTLATLSWAPSFFRSKLQAVHRQRSIAQGLESDKRFQSGCSMSFELKGLICTQVRGVSNASLGGKARHWWIVHPAAKELPCNGLRHTTPKLDATPTSGDTSVVAMQCQRLPLARRS